MPPEKRILLSFMHMGYIYDRTYKVLVFFSNSKSMTSISNSPYMHVYGLWEETEDHKEETMAP